MSLTQNKNEYVREVVGNIIDRLPQKALNQLLEGYNNDLDSLVFEMKKQTEKVLLLNETMTSVSLNEIEELKYSMDMSLKKYSYNYFKTTMLPNFKQGWRNLEWGNLIQLYPNLGLLASRGHGKSYEMCYAFPLWRMYSYDKPDFIRRDDIDNHNRKETCIITSTLKLASLHVDKIIEEIRFNDQIREKLNLNNKAILNKESITTETGSLIHTRGIDGFIRGLHVGATICDDIPDESSLYSAEQREKLSALFRGAIRPIVEPYGFLDVSGTPFSTQDIYSEIKRDKSFKVFEYPAIFPDGRLLAPERFSFAKLKEAKESLGRLVFAREYLVVPIADDATIFPFDTLMRATIGMDNVGYIDTIDASSIPMTKVVIGCDFARSGNVGADYTVYEVWGVDKYENYHLLHILRHQGLTHNQQINFIKALNVQFKPSVIVCENNGFQSTLVEMLKNEGLTNIKPFTTGGANKKSLTEGLPSLAALFERGVIKMPYRQSDSSKEKTDIILGEFNSIAFRSDKNTLESVGGHDDTVMSAFFAISELRNNNIRFQIDLV